MRTRQRREIKVERQARVNDRIRAPQVRLVGPDGKQLGVMSPEDALSIAREHELDLIEVAPDSDPPVCKIGDFERFRYEQKKRDKELQRKQRGREMKMITMWPSIGERDLYTKARKISEFLVEGRKVRVVVRFRARQMRHTEIGEQTLQQLVEMVAEHGLIDIPARLEGRNMSMTIAPKVVKNDEPAKG